MYVADNLIEQHTALSDDFAIEHKAREQKRHQQLKIVIQELLA